MTASYSNSSSGTTFTLAVRHNLHQAPPDTSPQAYQAPNGYVLDPMQQYARILYEHTRRQLDCAALAAAQMEARRNSLAYDRNEENRSTAIS